MRFLVPFITLFLAFKVSAQYQKPFGELKNDQKYEDYEVRIYRNEKAPPDTDTDPDHQDGFGCFEILRSGQQIYFQKGIEFEIGNIVYEGDSCRTNDLVRMGRNFTSDHQPNLLIKQWSGGAHCCYTFYIFEIGATFRFIDSIDVGDGEDADFKDLRRDGNLEVVMNDWTFRYWHTAFSSSPAPKMILRYLNGKYRPDLELMKGPGLTEKELEVEANDFKSQFPDSVPFDNDAKWVAPYQMWGRMLDLIYTGHIDLAWRLCDLSWPANWPGKAVFIKEFKEQLMTSPYYQDINSAGFQDVAVHKN